MKRLLAAAAFALIATGAHAGEKYVQMPIDFVGQWCSQDDSGSYVVPSRLDDDARCVGILSIHKYGLDFLGMGFYCYPIAIHVKEDRARSGTAYDGKMTARCHPNGPVGTGQI
jgi:hypothetical protein